MVGPSNKPQFYGLFVAISADQKVSQFQRAQHAADNTSVHIYIYIYIYIYVYAVYIY